MSKPTVLVTGSAGHLGKALMLALPGLGYTPLGIDVKASETTTFVGSIADAAFLSNLFTSHSDIAHIIHAATLHKPHVGSHTKHNFIQTNIAGTLALLEAAAATATVSPSPGAGQEPGEDDEKAKLPRKTRIKSFVYISTTSAFGTALATRPGDPAAWITESIAPQDQAPKNIYGLTKSAAEDLCRLVHAETSLPVVVLRTSRFFPEEDDDADRRAEIADAENLKVLELAYRRVDVADVVAACVCAMQRAGDVGGWGRYIVSAPTPFLRACRDGSGREKVLERLDRDAAAVFQEAVPGVGEVFARKGWGFLKRVDRVYDSARAVEELGWRPEYTFERAVERIASGQEWRSELALRVGKLGYHAVSTGVYTTREAESE